MKPLLAISSCLLGNNVRFNGSNSNNKMLREDFSDIFSYRIICPEVFAGLGVPRKPIHLQEYNKKILVLENDTSRDLTSTLDDACLTLVQKMKDVDGFILKKNSPSCGHKSAKVYNQEKNVIYINSKTNDRGSIFNLLDLIYRAKEIHCINSSFLHVVDRVKSQGKLFYHHNRASKTRLRKEWSLINY